MLRIGIISDTHGLLRPEAQHRLAGVDHIVHAGDIGRPEVIVALLKIAPVTAIKGNVDVGVWTHVFADTERVRLGGQSIYVIHDLKRLRLDPAAEGIDVVISGHTHRAEIKSAGRVLYLNPGSAGPRRFKLPVTLATLDIGPEGVQAAIHDVMET